MVGQIIHHHAEAAQRRLYDEVRRLPQKLRTAYRKRAIYVALRAQKKLPHPTDRMARITRQIAVYEARVSALGLKNILPVPNVAAEYLPHSAASGTAQPCNQSPKQCCDCRAAKPS